MAEAMLLLSPEEQDMLTIDALLGSIGDSMAELEQARRNKADAEVLAKITGKVTDTYVSARESFSDNIASLYATFEAMEALVSAQGCNHDHFLQSSLDAYSGQNGSSDSSHLHSHEKKHTHTHHASETKKDEKNKKKKNKQIKQLTGWALLGITQKSSL